jgi:hypothetical protein
MRREIVAYWGGLKQIIVIAAFSWDANIHWVYKVQLFFEESDNWGVETGKHVFRDKRNVVKIFEELK